MKAGQTFTIEPMINAGMLKYVRKSLSSLIYIFLKLFQEIFFLLKLFKIFFFLLCLLHYWK